MGMVFCRGCGKEIHESAQTCPSCGATQTIVNTSGKSKIVAGVLALFLGGFGIHRFYLGQWWGVFYLLLCWTGIPSIISLIEAIVFLLSNQQNWDNKYNNGVSSGETSGAATVLVVIICIFFVICMVGILAAVAIPSYHDYTKRAHVAAGFSAASAVKTLVNDYVYESGAWPDSSDLNMPAQEGGSVSRVTVDGGVIYVDISPSANIEGQVILVPTVTGDELFWTCTESTIKSKYLPSNCRK